MSCSTVQQKKKKKKYAKTVGGPCGDSDAARFDRWPAKKGYPAVTQAVHKKGCPEGGVGKKQTENVELELKTRYSEYRLLSRTR